MLRQGMTTSTINSGVQSMTNMNDSQEKFNEEMTRHGILKDIKGID